MLVVDPQALTVLANAATHDNAFMLRREHNEMVAKILHDPEASENDKFVALTMLRNAEVAAKGQLPFCQDTGTAICGSPFPERLRLWPHHHTVLYVHQQGNMLHR